MDRITVRYARFLSPGSFCANEWTVPVETTDPAAVAWPDDAYAFSVHERVDLIDGPETFKGETKQVGPLYYHPNSKVETPDEVERNPRATYILCQNMRINKYPAVIWTRWGNWPQAFDAERMQILPKPAITA